MFFLSFLFCSAKKETKKAVENQLLHWFSMARAPTASDVGIGSSTLLSPIHHQIGLDEII